MMFSWSIYREVDLLFTFIIHNNHKNHLTVFTIISKEDHSAITGSFTMKATVRKR